MNVRAPWPLIQALLIPSPHPRRQLLTLSAASTHHGALTAVQMCSIAVISVLFSPAAQLSAWIVEMLSWSDTNPEHLLPAQPDEHLGAKGTSLCCHILCAAFFKRAVLPRKKKLRGSRSGVLLCSGSAGRYLIFACALCADTAQCCVLPAEQGSFLALWFPILYPQTQKDPELLGFPGPFLPAGPG